MEDPLRLLDASSGRRYDVKAELTGIALGLKDAGHGKARVEGVPHCDWVLIDTGDVIIHLFRPEVRIFYNLEKMWGTTPVPRIEAGQIL